MSCINLNTTMNSIILNRKRSLSTPLLYRSNRGSETSSTSSIEFDDTPVCFSGRFDIPLTPNRTSKPGFKLLDILSGHVGSVSCIALCGEFILSASQAKDIIVWQQPDLRFFTKFGAGEGSVKAVVTVGNKVFTAHQDSRIRVWKVSRSSENVFRLIDTLPTTKDYLGKFMKQSNYVQIRRNHKKLWIEHADSISCLAVSNGLIYSGSWDKSLKVWRVSDLKCLESIKAHDDAINGLTVGPDGLVYSASADGKIKVWGRERDQNDTVLRGTLEGHDDVSMNAVIVDGNGTVFGGGSDGYLMGWRREEEEKKGWKLVVEVKAHKMAVLCLCYMGEVLCSGSADKSICLWREVGGEGGVCKVGVIGGHQGPVKCLQASSNCVGDGYLLYSGSHDKSLRVWWVSKDIQDEEET